MRFLLEDGKLNLCLRNLIEYKQHQSSSHNEGYNGPIADFKIECDKFEKGLGVILRNAWNHVEAIQTTDVHALITHVADVVQDAIHHPLIIEEYIKEGDLHQRQEILIFYYLACIFRHIDAIREERYVDNNFVFIHILYFFNCFEMKFNA